MCEILHAWEHRRAVSYLMLSLPLQAQEKTGNRQVKRGQGGVSLYFVPWVGPGLNLRAFDKNKTCGRTILSGAEQKER